MGTIASTTFGPCTGCCHGCPPEGANYTVVISGITSAGCVTNTVESLTADPDGMLPHGGLFIVPQSGYSNTVDGGGGLQYYGSNDTCSGEPTSADHFTISISVICSTEFNQISIAMTVSWYNAGGGLLWTTPTGFITHALVNPATITLSWEPISPFSGGTATISW